MQSQQLLALPFALSWTAWLVYWGISARNVKEAERSESRASRRSHSLPLVAGALVSALHAPPGSFLEVRFLPRGLATYALGLALTVLGLAFTVWARGHLGANWSGTVTRKQDHELIRSGPYAWVRHPIYSGLLLAFLGCLFARGDVGALLGCTLMSYGVARKIRIEERWLSETFGEAYARYREQVSMLVPGL